MPSPDARADIAGLREKIGALPRVRLACLPTPLDPAPRLSEAVGQEVLFKRDDLTGLALGGNKTRMFEFLIARALKLGADTIVAGAAAQSNYCRQLAAAAAKHGLRTVLALRSVRGEVDHDPQGNLLLDLLLGAEVTVHDVDEGQQAELLDQIAARLRVEGATPYLPQHDAYLGAVAYFDCALELIEQFDQLDRAPRALYLAAAGETYAGLRLGFKAAGYPLPVIGVNPGVDWWDVGHRVCELASRAAAALEVDTQVSRDEVQLLGLHGDEGYGLPAEAAITALKLVARLEGILLDPVYTSKAASVLLEHVASDELPPGDGPVVFLHTGGAPALFHYRDALAPSLAPGDVVDVGS
jgi:1-aminocyclopropane-1-carboxylate deaminase/D-cysteine desulfhydrase-like pyridoxal-dependent ACC family enzyme